MSEPPAMAVGGVGDLRWSEAWSVGVPEIDADHKTMIDLVGQMDLAAKGFESQIVVGSILATLMEYVDYHFRREEAVQAAVAYPGLPAHQAQHDALRRQVESFAGRFRTDPASVDVRELAAFLWRWLTQHIQREDMAFRPFVQDNPQARAAAAAVEFD